MKILGIESSCDETSVAIISEGKVTANLIASQDFHVEYGGVVPELSSRAHLQLISPLVKQALNKAGLTLEDIDVVAATAGPGLIGAVLVGLSFAKGLAYALNKPFIPVNHIEGHIFSGFLMEDRPEFPFLAVVLSGGHSFLLYVKDDLTIYKLGATIDDAAGEAFDKVAKLVGLGYPGGPKIQNYAEQGNPQKIKFPVAKTKNPYDFSFSGLKTSVLRYVQENYPEKLIPESDLPDLCASFEDAVIRAVLGNVSKALKTHRVRSIALVGGVAANKHIRNALSEFSDKLKIKFVTPELSYCGDNAAMIAYRGLKLFENGKRFTMDYKAFPSLPDDIFLKEL